MKATIRSLLSSFSFWSLAALAGGLAVGLLGFLTGSPAIERMSVLLQPLGALWLRALQLVILPVVILQLLTVLTGNGREGGLGSIGARAFGVVAAASVVVMVVSLALAGPVVRLYDVSPERVETIRSSAALEPSMESVVAEPLEVTEWLTGLVPTNVFRALAEGQIVQILLLTALFGLAVNRLPESQRRLLGSMFGTLNEAMLTLVRWIILVTPLGVFALMLELALTTGFSAAGMVAAFVAMNQGIQLLIVLALYPIAAVAGGVGLKAFARAVAPVQLVAVSTRSSLATMPVQMESGRDNLRFGPSTTGIVIPICVALFKITTLISNPVRVLFLAHVFGISLTPGQLVSFLVTVLLITFTELGLPRGGVPFRTVPAYLAVGIPLEGLIVLQAANDLEDYPDTLANATGMFATATALSRADRIPPDKGTADVGAGREMSGMVRVEAESVPTVGQAAD